MECGLNGGTRRIYAVTVDPVGKRQRRTFVEEEEDVVVGEVVGVGDDHLEFDVVQLGHVDGPRATAAAADRHRALLVRLAYHRVRATVRRKLHSGKYATTSSNVQLHSEAYCWAHSMGP